MITLTDAASSKVKELIDAEGQPELFLRVAVRPGGCSGLSYEMYFDSERATDDIEHDYGEVKVVVDPASSAYLTGASLDYKDGLQSGFTISNPNAQRTCGCGQSFS
jgi:iron-sulfur cluster assembly protein/iron-sulfur cluster insertion protein